MNPITLNFGLSSAPELADHGFQGLVVLPGAWFIAAARQQMDAAHGIVVRRAVFERPFILAAEDQPVRLAMSEGPQGIGCVFRSGESILARLELAREPIERPAPVPAMDGGDGVPGARVYAKLETNGNRYGPHFQRLAWLAAQEKKAAAGLRFDRDEFSPLWLDAGVQVLAALCAERGQTFVLAGIDEVLLFPGSPQPVRAQAELTDERCGDVSLLGADGRPCATLRGVRFSFLEPASPPLPLVVAATFTAEPIEEGLQFWSDEIKLPVAARFAPYGQVFQELLDAGSASRRNRDGLNALLVHLADWLPPAGAGSAKPMTWPEGTARHVLPNGMTVAHLNRHETEYVYQEIFADRCYLRHGIVLPPEAVIIDIGANIGLFALFARAERPDATVYSFEPSPIAFRALEANCQAYGPGLHAINAGVARDRGEAELTFYSRSSVFSSFHPDVAEDRTAIRAVVENMVRRELRPEDGPVDDYVRDLMSDRMDAQTFRCPLVSVSDIIREQGLDRIDLLKIDAEKCELDILRGISDAHWPLIRQVVVEVHDRTRAALAEAEEILAGRGFRCACEEERLLAGSGLFNLYAVREDDRLASSDAGAASAGERWTELQAKAQAFERALSAYAGAEGPPAVLVFCPPSPHGLGPGEPGRLGAVEQRIAAHARSLPGLAVIESSELRSRHPDVAWHLGPAEAAGHIPFTPEGFGLLATAVMRAVSAQRRAPFKAVAIDCDHTLWRGVCGEDGPLGVTVTPAHRAIQEFLLRQMQAGLMLCLCSKNEESDVWAVFERNPGMVLRREHIAASQIRWTPKSQGLRALASALNIGPDAILFLDDNPVEIAEVAAHCPEVLTVVLPAAIEQTPHWLEHYWVFDHSRATAEDQARTRMMQDAARRESFRRDAGTLAEFIAGLRLEVRVGSARPAELPRLAQLTQRTNQFNFTTLRRSEHELRRYLQDQGGHALSVEVRDRFGDYGCVGLVLYQLVGAACCVDTFLLSCRVLGRGVEHQVLAALAREAEGAGATAIELPLRRSEKNQPAADFIGALDSVQCRPEGDAKVYVFSTGQLRELRYEPVDADRGSAVPGASESAGGRFHSSTHSLSPEAWQQIAELSADAPRLRAAIERHRLRRAGTDPADVAAGVPATLPGKLLALWRRLLANPRVGLDDNFFDAGGSSLKAVQAVAAIRRELGLPVTVTEFFECPTIRRLSEKLEPGAEPAGAGAAQDALARGARRKARLRRTAA